MNNDNNYYVYVYIDPRNFEEFYYGKGTGSRKYAHLSDVSMSSKSKRISEIRKLGLEPIIRVIASGLNESEAYLIEATLLWKLGRFTDNIFSGRFTNKFRPFNTMHLDIPGFDYQHGIYYYNVGEGPHRNWDDYVKYGFISAGQGKRWRDSIIGFEVNDIFVAYLKTHGFVGVGRIKEKAKMIRDIKIDNKNLLSLNLKGKNMADNCDSVDKSEYVALVDWIKIVKREKAIWQAYSGLYTTTHVRASLAGQPKTLKFIENKFDVNFNELLR